MQHVKTSLVFTSRTKTCQNKQEQEGPQPHEVITNHCN